MLLVRRFADAAEFRRCVTPFLSRHEAGNNLPFRIISGLFAKSGPVLPEIYLAVCFEDASRDASVLGVALRTPPHNLVLSLPFPADALTTLLTDTAELDLPGVVGPMAEAEVFAAGWREQKHGTSSVTMRLGVYALEQVIPATPVPGRLRPAMPGDLTFAQEWIKAFHAERPPGGARSAPERWGAAPAGASAYGVSGLPTKFVVRRAGQPWAGLPRVGAPAP